MIEKRNHFDPFEKPFPIGIYLQPAHPCPSGMVERACVPSIAHGKAAELRMVGI